MKMKMKIKMKMRGMWSPGLMFHSSNHTRRPAVRSRRQLAHHRLVGAAVAEWR
jgi:hypothetical protein